MTEKVYDPLKLTLELQAINIPVESVHSTGEIVYQRDLTKAEKLTADAAVAAHDPSKTDLEIEKDLISEKGINNDDMLLALWKKVANDDPADMDALIIRVDGALDGTNV